MPNPRHESAHGDAATYRWVGDMYAVSEPEATAVVSTTPGSAGSRPTTVMVSRPAYVSGTDTSPQSTSWAEVCRPSLSVVTRGNQSAAVVSRTTCRLCSRDCCSVVLEDGWVKSSAGSPESSTSRTT